MVHEEEVGSVYGNGRHLMDIDDGYKSDYTVGSSCLYYTSSYSYLLICLHLWVPIEGAFLARSIIVACGSILIPSITVYAIHSDIHQGQMRPSSITAIVLVRALDDFHL